MSSDIQGKQSGWLPQPLVPLSRSHVGKALGGDELLQVDGAAPHQAEGRVHGSGTVHLPFVQQPHAVGVEEGDTARLIVQAHADARRHGQHAASLVLATATGGGGGRGVERSLGNEDLAHAHSDQRERLREVVAGILTAAVMPAVMVVPKTEDG